MLNLSKNKIKIARIGNFFKKIPKKLTKHPFLTFCGFLILALALGGFIFYRYVVLVDKSEISIPEKTSKFGETAYQEVLNQWQQREEKLKNIDSKEYFNPFKGSGEKIVFPTTTEEAIPIPEATSTPEENPPETPEKPIPSSNVEKLLAAANLYEFYIINNGWIPSVRQRAKVWQEKGLGLEGDYKGTDYQNMILLNKLKKELVP